MRRVLLGAALVAASVGFSGGPALAARPIKMGCPSAFEAMSVADVLAIARPDFEDDIMAADVNDDDLLCVKLLPEPIPLFEPSSSTTTTIGIPDRCRRPRRPVCRARRAAPRRTRGCLLTQTERTFFASSLLRPGPTSNSTVWPSVNVVPPA